jgi:hypothetical protein
MDSVSNNIQNDQPCIEVWVGIISYVIVNVE